MFFNNRKPKIYPNKQIYDIFLFLKVNVGCDQAFTFYYRPIYAKVAFGLTYENVNKNRMEMRLIIIPYGKKESIEKKN